MMVRPRKPTAALKLHGTYRKKRHATRVDESSLPADVVKPSDMAPIASQFWDDEVPSLFTSGVAKSRDLPALRGMCEWWGKYREAMVKLETSVLTLHEINTTQNLAGSAWKNFCNMASRFGMTPADRAKLAAEGKSQESDFDKDMAQLG
jgi:P27 family predicted phage terminase small subunit